MLKRLFVISLVCLLCLDLNADPRADDGGEDNETRSEKEEILVETIEVVGRTQAKKTVQSVSVFQDERIENLTEANVKAILNQSPGFLALSGGHPGQFTYSYARGASPNQSLYLIDGFKISDPSSSIGINTSLFSSSLFETAELVRGPLSNLYGSNAMGGAVNLRSGGTSGLETSLFWGSHHTYEGGVSAHGEFGRFTLHANGSWMRYSDGLDNDEFLNRGAVIKAGYSDNRTQAGVLFFVNLAESGIPFYMGVPTPNRRYTQDNYLVGLPLQFNLKGGIVRMRLSHQTNRYKFDDPDDAWSPYYVNSSWVNGAEIQFETTLFSRLRLQAGFDRAAHRILNEVEDGQVVNEEKTNITSIFINTGLDLRRLTLAASVRYDKYKHLDAALSPQLGLALMAADWLRLRASLGRSFRAPTLPELFNPAWGNPHLEPERGTSWEIGAEVYTGPAVLSLVYFDSAYDHLIGYDPVNWIFVNIDQADISGIEIGARFKLWQTVQAHAAYTHLNTHDVKNDQELLRRPRHALSLMLTYTNRHFAVSAEMRYVGRRLDYDELLWATGESPAFDTYNFSLQVPVNRKLSLVGRATNAFDRSYEEILGYPAPGRRFLLGVRYKFL